MNTFHSTFNNYWFLVDECEWKKNCERCSLAVKVHVWTEPPYWSVSLFSTADGTVREVTLPSFQMDFNAVSLSHMFPFCLKEWKIKWDHTSLNTYFKKVMPNLKSVCFMVPCSWAHGRVIPQISSFCQPLSNLISIWYTKSEVHCITPGYTMDLRLCDFV